MVEYKHLQRRSLNDSIMLNFNRHFDRDTDGPTGPITWLYASIVECWPTDALTVRCRTLCRQIYWLLIYPVYLVSPTTQHKTAFLSTNLTRMYETEIQDWHPSVYGVRRVESAWWASTVTVAVGYCGSRQQVAVGSSQSVTDVCGSLLYVA